MSSLIRYSATAVKVIHYKLMYSWSSFMTYVLFRSNGVVFHNFVARGVPIINTRLSSSIKIGRDFQINSGKYHNMIGRQQRCYFVVSGDCELIIGDNVGMSSTAIVCQKRITIGNNVRIGGGTVIYDTDFHSLSPEERVSIPEDIRGIKTKEVLISDGVFIGAHSIILKGVTIGQNAIVGAGSVVTKSIPENEIWGGNPAKFIRRIVHDNR